MTLSQFIVSAYILLPFVLLFLLLMFMTTLAKSGLVSIHFWGGLSLYWKRCISRKAFWIAWSICELNCAVLHFIFACLCIHHYSLFIDYLYQYQGFHLLIKDLSEMDNEESTEESQTKVILLYFAYHVQQIFEHACMHVLVEIFSSCTHYSWSCISLKIPSQGLTENLRDLPTRISIHNCLPRLYTHLTYLTGYVYFVHVHLHKLSLVDYNFQFFLLTFSWFGCSY